MSDLLLILALLAVLVLVPIVLLARRRRPAPSVAPTSTPRAGLSFQRPVVPVSKAPEMQVTMADKPPMFANSPAVLEGETAPERLPSS